MTSKTIPSLESEMEAMFSALDSVAPVKELHGKLLEAEKERDAAISQLYKYATDFQKLLATKVDNKGLKKEKQAAIKQLEKFSHDFNKLLQQREVAYEALAKSHLDTLRRLAVAAEYKDGDTGVHIIRMSQFSAILAKSMGMDEEYCTRILQASPMHDIGKIGVPDSVLKKPGGLTKDEREIIQKHPEYGAKILGHSDVPVIQMAADIALSHHEKFDGSGYPRNLRGDDIPFCGRIVALADYFDALTMDRVYRPAFDDEKVFEMITENTGSHFDPEVVQAFFSAADDIIASRERINQQPAS